MSKLELDLGKIGSTRYLNENEKSVEMFTSKDFQEWKNTDTINVFKSKLDKSIKINNKLRDIPFLTCLLGAISIFIIMAVTAYLRVTSDVSNYALPVATLGSFGILVVAMIAETLILNKKLKEEIQSLEEFSKKDKVSEQILLQTKTDSGAYSLKTLNKYIEFMEKLASYPDVTVYRLKDSLTFSTQNFDVYFTDILFLENETGNYFTYAYSNEYLDGGKEQTMTKLTVFDVNIETFEFKPRL